MRSGFTELEALLDGGFDDIAQASGGDAAGTSSASGPSQQSVNGKVFQN